MAKKTTKAPQSQDEYYQPIRLQVMWSESRYRQYSYRIIKRDMARVQEGSDSIVDFWITSRQINGWASSIPEADRKGNRSTIYSKKEAIDLAKRIADEYSLPFRSTKDFLRDEEVYRGPERTCLLCGLSIGRSWEQGVCKQCREDRLRGEAQRTRDDLQTVLIEPDRISGTYWRDEITLNDVLPGLLGVPLEEVDFNRLRQSIGQYTFISSPWRMEQARNYQERGLERDTGMRILRVSEFQVQGLEKLALLFDKVRKDAYKDGVSHGEGMLFKMASGELSVDQLDEMRKREKR